MTSRICTFVGAGALCAAGNYSIKKNFPPEMPSTLNPEPGYRFYGYMGCPASKVEEIAKRKRNLFFTPEVTAAQRFALSRTSLIARLTGKDEPVVLQIEIRDDYVVKQEDLWTDPHLKQPPSPVLIYISLHPAIPPEIQEAGDLKVRIHHVVTCSFHQEGGHFCRAVQKLMTQKKIDKNLE